MSLLERALLGILGTAAVLAWWTLRPGAEGELASGTPQIGAKAEVHVRVGGEVVAEDSNELTSALKDNEAFFAQVYMNDYATGESGS